MWVQDIDQKRGVINLVFGENSPPSSVLSPKEVGSRVIGVILVNQYNLKSVRNYSATALMKL